MFFIHLKEWLQTIWRLSATTSYVFFEQEALKNSQWTELKDGHEKSWHNKGNQGHDEDENDDVNDFASSADDNADIGSERNDDTLSKKRDQDSNDVYWSKSSTVSDSKVEPFSGWLAEWSTEECALDVGILIYESDAAVEAPDAATSAPDYHFDEWVLSLACCLSFSCEVLKYNLDHVHGCNQHASESHCSHMVPKAPFVGKRDADVSCFVSAVTTIPGEVPHAAGHGNDELFNSVQKGQDPQNAEEHE